tara:strand:- start:123 stop:317 length:195 start_codon:yes stop_codon:yes gene_type:complete
MDTVLATITAQTITLLCWGVLGLCLGIVVGLYLRDHWRDSFYKNYAREIQQELDDQHNNDKDQT